ncbi:MAG: hypothetical protein K8T20_11890, partial [Planctomycetes bacterium]|nr:hypothetical protein [Planctomycetota bacterium]
MRKVAVGLVLALACGLRGVSEEPKDGGEPRCEIKLTNGSLIKGTFKGFSSISLKTRHGVLKFVLKDLRNIVWGNVKKEELDTVTASDGAFKGWIDEIGPIEVDTGYGFLKIPTEAIKTLRVTMSGRTLGDSFDSDDLSSWTKFGPSPWTVTDGKLTEQPSGNYDSIQFNEVLEGAYTVEVDITNANNAGILFHAQDQNNASGIWLNPNN